MTVADLLRGDRPWRLVVRTNPRPLSSPVAALCALGAIGAAVAGVLVSPALLWPLAALLAAWRWRPEVWLTGGGRRALSSSEYVGWVGYTQLAQAEAEHEARARRG